MEGSVKYTEPFEISATTVVKARAFLEGKSASDSTTKEMKVLTVTFDLDGGALGGASAVDAQKVRDGGKASDPGAPTKDGCDFIGWFKRSDTNVFSFDAQITEDTALVAKWNDKDRVKRPSVKWGTGSAVKIECGASGAKIYYTTGASESETSDPTAKSAEYKGEIPISATTFVKAIALKDGLKDSEIAGDIFSVWTVSFNMDGGKLGGASAVDAQKVRDGALATAPAGSPAKDGFTFGGWRALTASGEMAGGSFDFTKPVTSDVALKAAWTEWGKVESPSISWGAGKAVKIECGASDAKIYYTTGASAAATADPTAKSDEYTGEISIGETTYVKAIALKDGMKDSDVVASEAFNIWTVSFNLDGGKIGSAVAVDAQKVRDKTSASDPGDPAKDGFNFGGWHEDGVSNAFDFTAAVTRDVSLKAEWTATDKVQKPRISWGTGKAVKIECATTGAKIYYTTGASEAATAAPTSASSEYTGEIPIGETTYVKAIALKDGMTASDAAGDIFNIWNVEFNLNGGDGSAGAQKVRDGALATAPADNPTKAGFTFKEWRKTGASGAFDFESAPITENTQLKAEWTEWSKVASPSISWGAGKAVKIACATSGAKIYYTTGASEAATAAPTAKSAEYTGEIPISETTYVKAIALKDGMTASDAAGDIFNIWAVSFDLDGGKLGSAVTVDAQKVRDGASATAPAEDPVKAGSTFSGWYALNSSGSMAGSEFDFKSAVSANVSLKAKWDALAKAAPPAIAWESATSPCVKITCATEGATIYYEIGDTAAATDDPTEKSAEYTKPVLIAGSKVVKAIAVKDGMTSSAVTTSDTFSTYAVTFDLDGGEAGGKKTLATQYARSGQLAAEPSPAPTKSGAIFSGWFSAGAKNAFDFESGAITGDIALTARWDAYVLKATSTSVKLTLQTGKTVTKNVGISTNCGAFTVTGGDSAVATQTVSGNTITFTAVAKGSCSFTVASVSDPALNTEITVTVSSPAPSGTETPADANVTGDPTATKAGTIEVVFNTGLSAKVGDEIYVSATITGASGINQVGCMSNVDGDAWHGQWFNNGIPDPFEFPGDYEATFKHVATQSVDATNDEDGVSIKFTFGGLRSGVSGNQSVTVSNVTITNKGLDTSDPYDEDLKNKTATGDGSLYIDISSGVKGDAGDEVEISFKVNGAQNYKQIGLGGAPAAFGSEWWVTDTWSETGFADGDGVIFTLTAEDAFNGVNGTIIAQAPITSGVSSTVTLTDLNVRNVTKKEAAPSPGANYVEKFTHTFASSDSMSVAELKTFAGNMGVGWNLGNSFDAQSGGVSSETAWNNPAVNQTLIHAVKAAGFKTVRMPITWMGHIGSAPAYTIASSFMNRIKEVVGWITAEGMKVIINIHHDGADSQYWLSIRDAAGVYNNGNGYKGGGGKDGYDETRDTAIKNQLYAMWTQIATEFKDKKDSVIFETMNEIHDGGWGYGENLAGDTQQYKILNKWNQVCVYAIRNAGAANIVQCQGYCCNPEYTMNKFKKPVDCLQNRMTVSVHYYGNNDFSLDAKTSVWGTGGDSDTTYGEKGYTKNLFNQLKTKFVDAGVPVVIGECGSVYHGGTDTYRQEFDTFMVTQARTYGLVPVIWDNGGMNSGAENSGLFNRNTGDINSWCTDLVPAIITAGNTAWGGN